MQTLHWKMQTLRNLGRVEKSLYSATVIFAESSLFAT